MKNLINGDTQLDISLFKNNLTSNVKGVIGESVFSDMIGGEVIGFLGNKTDVIKQDKKFSVKTTYGNSWNNHLAYISNQEITNIFLERKRFSDIEKNSNDFKKFCFSLFSGNEKIDVLTLQKIKIQDLNNSMMESTQYLIPMSLIEKLITEKSYFFNNNELILVYEREQVFKLSIKERSNKLQAMIITNCENMEYLIEKNLIEKMEKDNVKIKPKF